MFTDYIKKDQLSFIYAMYSPDCWYWELVEMMRKLILTSIIMLIENKSLSQIIAGLIVTGIFIVAQTKYMPFLNSETDMLQCLGMITLFSTLVFATTSKYAEEMMRNDAPILDSDKAPSIWWILAPMGLTSLYAVYLVIRALGTVCMTRSGDKKTQANVGVRVNANGAWPSLD